MRLEWLEMFLEVASVGSTSAVARNMGTNQPAVSRAIKAIEDELHVILFERTSDGMHLTEVGERLLPFVMKVVEDSYLLEREASLSTPDLCSDLLDDVKVLNVVVSPIVLDSIVSPILDEVELLFPKIELKIHVLDSINPNDLLNLPDFDLYIGHNIEGALSDDLVQLNQQKYTVENLFSENFRLIMNKNHPLAKYQEVSFDETEEFLYILHDNGFSENQFYRQYCHEKKNFIVLMKSNNPRNIKEALRISQAVFFTTRFLAKRDYSVDENLVILTLRDLKIEYFCMYPEYSSGQCIVAEILKAIKYSQLMLYKA